IVHCRKMHGRGASERLEKQTVVSFDQKYMRNNTLLQDYKSSGKSSVFSDMRIGEQNEELQKLDKKIKRPKLEMRKLKFDLGRPKLNSNLSC
nr:hypothetical protein [Tanacetum cinerariifolium]